jgi:hypothetical protein
MISNFQFPSALIEGSVILSFSLAGTHFSIGGIFKGCGDVAGVAVGAVTEV